MKAPITAEAALLQALLGGPSYGLGLITRIRRASRGRLRLGQGTVYPALRALEGKRLVRSWIVNVRGTGRPRTYCELTPKGMGLAQAQREAIAGLFHRERPRTVSRRELAIMSERLEECFELSDFCMQLRSAAQAAGL